jgi:hypothetical protein
MVPEKSSRRGPDVQQGRHKGARAKILDVITGCREKRTKVAEEEPDMSVL